MNEPNLFDIIPNIPLANKIDAFYNANTQIKRGTQKAKCLEYIINNPHCCQNEISMSTGIARHLVPDRVLTLVREGFVIVSGSKVDSITGHNVTTYISMERK